MTRLPVTVVETTLDLPADEDEVLVERGDGSRMWIPLDAFAARPMRGQPLVLCVTVEVGS